MSVYEKYELSEGVTYKDVDPDVIRDFEASCSTSYKCGFIHLQPYNLVMPKCYLKYQKEISEFKVRKDDVWVASFPKTGTTWISEMIRCIIHDLDYDQVKSEILNDRVIFMEFCSIEDELADVPVEHDSLKRADDSKHSPRIIKTHLPFEALPKDFNKVQPKLIYVTRNPRDTCVSFFNHWKLFQNFKGTFETFVNAFLDDVCGYNTPFFANVLGFWKIRNQPNVLFVTYEEMKKDLPAVIRKVSQFLAKPMTEEQVATLAKHLSFDSMKKNDKINKSEVVKVVNKAFGREADSSAFLNKGKTGSWRDKLTPEMLKRFEEWEKQNLEGSDFRFVYDL